MAGIKITNFLGKAPKIAPELLPNTAAQIATSCKLYSGDLIPYPDPVVVDNTGRTGTLKTIYALRDPSTGGLKWLSWTTDVDIAVASSNLQDEQRFYYTGDGAPKVSNYELATSGAAPYPTGYYDLGLPVPPDSATLTTVASTFTTKATTSFARDAGNIVTIVTSTAHELKTGAFITVSGFTYRTGTYNQAGTTTITVTISNHGLANGATVTLDFTSGAAVDGTFTISNVTTNTFDVTAAASATTSGNVGLDIRSFNATNVECTVVNSTTFTYFSPGFQITTTSYTDGKVDLGGLTQARSYVFTWYTPWEEESIASKPSTNLYIKEGVTVTVSNLPTTKPAGNNFVRGVRLYRTLSSTSGTEYFLLNTLWFPTGLASVERTSGVSRVTLLFPHNLGIDDRFKISGCTDASFNITGGIVTDLIDDYTFEYAQAGADVPNTLVGAGALYHDVSENPPTTAARYWGDVRTGTYVQSGSTTIAVIVVNHGLVAGTPVVLTFTSGAAVSGTYTIDSVLNSNTFFVVADVSASTTGDVTISAYDFVDDYDSRALTDILGSDEYEPPPEDLQGITSIQGNILVGFVGNTLYFSEPALPHAWPAAYATPVGDDIVALAAIAGSVLVLTKSYPYVVSTSDPASGISVSRIDAQYPCLNAKSVVTMGYGIVWSTNDGLAVLSTATSAAIITKLLYNNDTWTVDIDPTTVVAEYYGENYFASHSLGSFVFEQDAKVGGFFVDAAPTFSASWYDAQSGKLYYSTGLLGDVYEWDDLAQPASTMEWKSKVFKTKDMINLGAARVVADYSLLTSTWDATTITWESALTNWNNSNPVTFKLWVDKQLLFTTTLTDANGFRLPTGYRTDTFEVGVEGNVRVRAIHLAETMLGLREV